MALGLTPIQIIEKGTHPQLVIADDWERIQLKHIATVQNGFAFSSKLFNHNEGLPLIRIRDIFSSKTQNLYSGEYKDEFLVSKGDILIGMDGDFKVSKWPGKKGLLNQRVCRILFDSNHYEKEFLFLCIQPYLDAIHSETSAVTVKHLSSRTLNDIPFPLPPVVEQKAIVKKIEELFSSLDSGIADLKKAQDQLVIYRQAVLKKAFDLNSKKYKIQEVCKEIFAGGDKPKDFFSKEKTEECSIPIIANAVANNGLYGYTKYAKVNDTAITIAARGSGTGHVELREEPFLPIVRLITIIPNLEKVVIKYLMYFLKNLNIERSGSAIPQLTIPMVKGFEIHLPSKQEQHKIILEIESRLSVCDAVEKDIADSLEKAQALRQSILKKAFEGKLLSEEEIAKCKADKNYEPATFLLEKIKAEKEK